MLILTARQDSVYFFFIQTASTISPSVPDHNQVNVRVHLATEQRLEDARRVLGVT